MKKQDPQQYYYGVDCGSSAIKVVVCDQKGKVLERNRKRTLFPIRDHVLGALSMMKHCPCEGSSLKPDTVVTLTGYGRHHIDFAKTTLTEIKAHFLGVKSQVKFKDNWVLIDMGGQDSKIIHVKENKIAHFVMNRKCAAGTGAFIEELANRLELDLSELASIARTSDKELTLNSFCTVFAVQEAIKVLMSGEKVANLIHALYRSVVKRVLEMAPLEYERIVFSGGVSVYHPLLIEIFRKNLPDKTFQVAPDAEYCGALGAALYGIENRRISG